MTQDARQERIPWESQTEDGQVLLSMPWEIFVLGAALLSIANLVLIILVRNPDLEQVVSTVDTLLIVIFAIDLLRRLRVADDNREYLTKGLGWLDVISIMPALRIARILRIFRAGQDRSPHGRS